MHLYVQTTRETSFSHRHLGPVGYRIDQLL